MSAPSFYAPQLLHSNNKITWTISNFSPNLLEGSSSFWKLNSPIIEMKINSGEKKRYTTQYRYFQLIITRNRTCIALSIEPVNNKGAFDYTFRDKDGVLKFEIGLLQRRYSYLSTELYHPTSGKIEFKDFGYNYQRMGRLINFNELISGEDTNRFYPTNKKNEISIVANLFYIEKNFTVDRNHTIITENKEIALSTQYEQMFNNDKYSDFTIITLDGQRIPVHRNILSARSVVFDAMLQTKMKENEDNTALIKDIEGKTLIEFLRFLYSGKVQDLKEIAGDLLYAANKYELPDLKPLCVKFLCYDLEESNVLDTTLIANLHSEESLKRVCFAFIKMNYENIKNDEMWKELPVKLIKEILDYVLLDCECLSNVIQVSTNYATPIRTRSQTTAPVTRTVPTVNVNVNILADAIANRMRIAANDRPAAPVPNPAAPANNQAPAV